MPKICSDCGIEKPDTDFYTYTRPNRPSKNTYSHCKTCNTVRTKKWKASNKDKDLQNRRDFYHKHKDRRKLERIQKTYGLSPEEYEKLLNAMDRRCYICNKHESECANGLHVDHNHITGKVRGVLCFSCNAAIGYLKESPELLDKARAYITSSLASCSYLKTSSQDP